MTTMSINPQLAEFSNSLQTPLSPIELIFLETHLRLIGYVPGRDPVDQLKAVYEVMHACSGGADLKNGIFVLRATSDGPKVLLCASGIQHFAVELAGAQIDGAVIFKGEPLSTASTPFMPLNEICSVADENVEGYAVRATLEDGNHLYATISKREVNELTRILGPVSLPHHGLGIGLAYFRLYKNHPPLSPLSLFPADIAQIFTEGFKYQE